MNEPREIGLTYQRDEDTWMVWVTEEERAHTYGHTIGEARKNILEVIELWRSLEEDREFDESRDYELVETFDLGEKAPDIAAVREDRAALAAIEERLAAHTRSAAKWLTKQGISRRDAAEVLGISFQRVQQLVKG